VLLWMPGQRVMVPLFFSFSLVLLVADDEEEV
jgi:hypothetical protein